MPSPVEGEDIVVLAETSALCDRLGALVRLNAQFKDFLDWLLNDSGEIDDDVLEGFQDRITPVGAIVAWGGPALPSDKWRVCNGEVVLRSAYPSLFEKYGTTWGAGDGSTTFGLPDLQDRVIVGVSGTKTLASTGGAASVELDLSHYHGIGQTYPNVNINFLVRDWAKSPNGTLSSITLSGDGVEDNGTAFHPSGDISSTTEIKDDDTGDLSAVNIATQPPYRAAYWIIKVL